MGSKVARGSRVGDSSTTKPEPAVPVGAGERMASTGGVAVAMGLKGS